MSTWRYRAVTAQGGTVRRGEIAADSAALARASLRSAGLRVLDVQPVRTPIAMPAVFGRTVNRHMRSRRADAKAEFLDSLATMLTAGLTIVDALSALRAGNSGRSPRRRLALRLHDAVSSGEKLSVACGREPGWFDSAEVAMLAAGEHSGELASILRRVAERAMQASALAGRLVSVLMYPAIVAAAGVAVTVFLSVRTLPEIVGVLAENGIETPPLTRAVMAVGNTIWSAAPLLLGGIPVLVLACLLIARTKPARRMIARIPLPNVARDVLLARLLTTLVELLNAGVPFAEALRVAAPTLGGLGSARLTSVARRAADSIERGESASDAVGDPRWFGEDARRTLAAGESAGELEQTMSRLAEHAGRRARRAIDRLATLLEPAAILTLAGLIGTVVLAAVLPLTRLQEVLQ